MACYYYFFFSNWTLRRVWPIFFPCKSSYQHSKKLHGSCENGSNRSQRRHWMYCAVLWYCLTQISFWDRETDTHRHQGLRIMGTYWPVQTNPFFLQTPEKSLSNPVSTSCFTRLNTCGSVAKVIHSHMQKSNSEFPFFSSVHAPNSYFDITWLQGFVLWGLAAWHYICKTFNVYMNLSCHCRLTWLFIKTKIGFILWFKLLLKVKQPQLCLLIHILKDTLPLSVHILESD